MLQSYAPQRHSNDKLPQRQRRIFEFLSEHPLGVLSTVTPDGDPHGVVVYYTIDTQFRIHILTRTHTQKYSNIQHNDHVMLTVCDSKTQTTAQITGVATERSGSNDINTTAGGIFGAAVRSSTNGLPPIVKLQAGAFTTFQITPVQIRMAIYARPEAGEYGELFESIESFDLV